MSEPEFLGGVLVRTVSRCKNNLSGKILQREIFLRWKEIAGDFAGQITPIKIQKKTLVIYANNPAVKDTMKFLAGSLVEKINSTVGRGEKIIEKISFGKTFETPEENSEEIVNPKIKKISSSEDWKKINLTDEEIADCEKKLSDIEDETQRRDLLKTFLARAKLKKWRLKNGWHECKICGELCEPNKNICDFCKIHEREKMRKKIRRIFFDLPWKTFSEVQREICAEMPHMAEECTLFFVESVWVSLVTETAARVSYGDKKSLDAKFLVMLFKHVDEKNLTEKLINRALKELKFNLADLPPFKEKNNSQPTKVL